MLGSDQLVCQGVVHGYVLKVGQEVLHGLRPGVPLSCLDSRGVYVLPLDFVLTYGDFVGQLDLGGRGFLQFLVEQLKFNE